MSEQKIPREIPLEVARALIQERYADCEVAFVAGSTNRGDDTASSDIDLIIMKANVDHAWRESIVYRDWPIEIFVHDLETLNYFFREVDYKEGIPALPKMVSEGLTIPEGHPMGESLKALANDVLLAGPPPWTEVEKNNFRYGISDSLDDLRAPRNQFEGLAVVAKLHGQLAFFLFRSEGKWASSGKHISRLIQKEYPQLFPVWTQAFKKAFQGDLAEVIALTELILEPHGGPLFAGYKQSAPDNWRKPV